ncbi:Hypothetical protein GbCGDNIH9_8591 [Granulibacter bethesdensis]|uniref:Uncharacterized protein n=1 Tax=Granulibacter bethesdensis TaxID=364410 RepID=A0AAC9KD82_9PROT|nr:Hypothetical protein GbCGDNIH9_8591 [Granulibacter bethesdensis]APH62463.1 Hypothetical protein GbCGDNIH8_8591 [Granulibacter bethesdensis]
MMMITKGLLLIGKQSKIVMDRYQRLKIGLFEAEIKVCVGFVQ